MVGGGRVVRRCWVNFQCRGVLLIWIIVGQGPIALAIGAGGGCLDIFSLIYHFSFLSPSLWETARYRLKYCLKGPLNPEQPTKSLMVKTTMPSPLNTNINIKHTRMTSLTSFLALLFSKKTSRYCHSPGVVVGGGVVQKL